MASAPRNSTHRLSHDLTCSICLDLFKQPVSLPCDHTFCFPCISGYWRSLHGNFSCPQCREIFPEHAYHHNRMVANIVENYSKAREEGDSALVPSPALSQLKTLKMCERHKEELKLYCDEDQELVCLVCGLSQEHKNHTLIYVDEAMQKCRVCCIKKAREEERTVLEGSLAALQEELKQALDCERETKEQVQIMKEQTADMKERIEAQFSELHQFLYQEEKMMQVKLKTEERRALIQLDERKAVIGMEISRLKRALRDIEERLRAQEPDTLLKNIKNILNRPQLKFEKPGNVSVGVCEGRFAGPLHYKVWKTMKAIINITPFPITLDPKTANPWLRLSPLLNCVRYESHPNSVPDNPERFNAALSLLGCQGFNNGKHYWEVEVHSVSVWTLGVAHESVSRKGVVKAFPANGFWTLSLSYGVQYMAGTSPPTILSLDIRPNKIGVFLDYKRGLVSFYNADDMSHLYTFNDKFTEQLFPYFNLGFLDKANENEPLKVFLPQL